MSGDPLPGVSEASDDRGHENGRSQQDPKLGVQPMPLRCGTSKRGSALSI